MKSKLIAIVAVAALVLAACGDGSDAAQGQSPGQGGSLVSTGITVSGEGRVSGTPDTLTVTIGVSVLRQSVEAAVGDAAGLAQGLVDALRAEGVADDDVRTVDYSIFPEWDYQGERQTLRGYRVTNSLEVKIRDLERAGEIIDAVAATAGDEVQVHGVSFSLDDNEGLLAAARADAWADAEAKARQLAGLAGVTLGAPVEIVESLGTPPPMPMFAAAMELAAADTPIQPGSLAVTVTVNVKFAIES